MFANLGRKFIYWERKGTIICIFILKTNQHKISSKYVFSSKC